MRTRKIVVLLALCLIVPMGAFAQDDAIGSGEDSGDATYDLIAAVQDANVPDVRTALENGGDASAMTDGGMPILTYAAFKGEADIVAALMEAGADLEAKDKTGGTALMYAAQFDADDIVTALVEAGADVNATDSIGWTPLIRAVIGGNAEAVSALMAAGANTSATDFFGRDALREAQGRDLDDLIAILTGTAEPSGS